MNRSIFNIKDFVPCYEYGEKTRCYSNKLLSEFDSDDLADYVFDQCDGASNTCWDEKHWLYQLECLDEIPKSYARVYLYGVWQVLQDILKTKKYDNGSRTIP